LTGLAVAGLTLKEHHRVWCRSVSGAVLLLILSSVWTTQ